VFKQIGQDKIAFTKVPGLNPFEKVNIVHQPENKELLKYLRNQLLQWREEQGDTIPVYVREKYVAPERSHDYSH